MRLLSSAALLPAIAALAGLSPFSAVDASLCANGPADGPHRDAGLRGAEYRLSFLQPAGIVVEASAAEADFGQAITFTLTAHSDSPINSVVLFWQTSDDPRTQVETLAVAPDLAVRAAFRADLDFSPVPPFSPVKFWWQIGDSAGRQLTTEAQVLFYEDDRFAWQTVASGGVIVHWVDGDAAFAQAAVDTAAAGLPRANRAIGAPLPDAVIIYIYPTLADFQSAQDLAGRQWIGGHANPQLGVVLLAIPPGPEAALQMERDIPHELTHILVYQYTGAGYANVPAWLDEGLAVSNETQPDPNYRLALEQAVSDDGLIDIPELCGAFAVDPARATLAYAESGSLARYIHDRWGAAKISALLDAYAEGASCEGGVQRALGVSLAGLQADWSADALRADPLVGLARAALPWLVLLVPAVGLGLLAFAPKKTESQP